MEQQIQHLARAAGALVCPPQLVFEPLLTERPVVGMVDEERNPEEVRNEDGY